MTEHSSFESVRPNGVIGILGGGQLGRMLCVAASQLGLRTHIFAPDEKSPARDVCAINTIAQYDDEGALRAFARNVDVVTFEFENVPSEAVSILTDAGASVSPGAEALAISQDRLVEKKFVIDIGAETAPFHPVDDLASLKTGLGVVGDRAVLKTRRLGYDGKGQTVIRKDQKDLELTWEQATQKAWEEIGARPAILEGFVDFDCEISIIGARSRNGQIALFDPTENQHRTGILRRSSVPAKIAEKTIKQAKTIAASLLEKLDYVGVVGVEFFVLKNGDVLVNEFAPRVHNSGHWTLDACAVCQFEQHIRAVAGWPLGDPTRHSDAVMENLIGDDVDDWHDCAKEKNLCVHLYGKAKKLPGRKMGHVTKISTRTG